jgi:hypothetical protein
MKEITIDPIWIFGTLFTILGVGGGWYIMRLDSMVEHLRDEIIGIRQDIGSLKNADTACTRDQDILKRDMSHIRETMLKMVARRFLRKGLRRDYKKEARRIS